MTRPDHNSSFSRGTSRTALVVVGVLALLGLAYAILRVDILRARIVVLQNSSKTLEDSNRQLQMRLEELLKTQQGNTIQLNQMQTELANTHEQLGGLRDGVTPAMQQWARIEAVYLLRIARDQLQLGHDVDSATHSLAAALTALNGHGETEAVQRQLIQQLQQLRELPVAEYARAQQQLQQSALIVAQLPLRKPHLLDSVRETLPESDLARGWAQLQHALSSLISVHNDASPALNDATQLLGQTQLQSLLTQAALAIRGHDQTTYQTALKQAQTLITLVLDTKHTEVQTLQRQLQQLAQLNIAPALPDLDGSIRTLEHGLPTSLSGQIMSQP